MVHIKKLFKIKQAQVGLRLVRYMLKIEDPKWVNEAQSSSCSHNSVLPFILNNEIFMEQESPYQVWIIKSSKMDSELMGLFLHYMRNLTLGYEFY